MGYPTSVKAVICYIESHIREETVDYADLERQIGFSHAYIRELFRRNTGYPLAQYVKMRKVKCSALDLIHSDKTILEIAYQYGFSNPETYTRTFRRVTGITPDRFRKKRRLVGKEELAAGVYGIGLLTGKEKRSDIIMDKNVYKNNGSTVLYGVPRVGYGTYGGGTPYPICLKAVSEYLGEDLDYSFIMAASAAAFRLVWNPKTWDLSNVDIFHTFHETNEVYRMAASALGREFSFLGREQNTAKEEFCAFIRQHIDEGYPCIALGVIGPPEPCIITGYRENGDVLLGWNFFQNDPEFASGIEIDESGYFVCRSWWENTDTQAVMCMGAVEGEPLPVGEILQNAVTVLTGRTEYGYCKGLFAYDAWKTALQRESEFTVGGNYSLLFEKMLCQTDAITCVSDGRSSAARYLNGLAQASSGHSGDYRQIADAFAQCAKQIEKMWEILGTPENMDKMLERFSNPEVRKQLCRQIDLARQSDAKALDRMKKII